MSYSYISPNVIEYLRHSRTFNHASQGSFWLGMTALAGFYASWGDRVQAVLIEIAAMCIIMYIQLIEISIKRNGGANGAILTLVLGFFWTNGVENAEGESQSKHDATGMTDDGVV